MSGARRPGRPIVWLVPLALLVLTLALERAVAPGHGLELRFSALATAEDPNAAPPPVEIAPPPDGETFARFAGTRTLRRLQCRYEGLLEIRHAGSYFFEPAGNGRYELRIDGRASEDPRRLDPGLHSIAIDYAWSGEPPEPSLSARWSKDVPLPRPLPASVVHPPSTRAWRLTASRLLRAAAIVLLGVLALAVLHATLRPRRFRELCFGAITAVGAVLLFLVAAEIVLRATGVRPREYVPADVMASDWWIRYPGPGETRMYSGWLPLNVKEFEEPITLNSLGWRDRDYSLEKPPGTFRVLVVGDSYVEGKEVPLERTFHKLLETRLNGEPARPYRVEVLALARGGTGTADHLRFLRRPGLRFAPDLVVLSFFPGNDVVENSDELSERYSTWLSETYLRYVVVPKIAIHDRGLIVPGSWLNHFLVDRAMTFYVANPSLFHAGLEQSDLVDLGIGVYGRGPYDETWTAAWDTSKRLILDTRELAERNGAGFLLMIAHSIQVTGFSPDRFVANDHPELDLRRPIRELTELCRAQDLWCLDLEPTLTERLRETGERYYWRHDAHWNATGHRIVAETLHEALSPRLPARPIGGAAGD